MRASQMEKYVWATIIFYFALVIGLMIIIVLSAFPDLIWMFVGTIVYLPLVLFLNIWRLNRHPRSVYQMERAKREASR